MISNKHRHRILTIEILESSYFSSALLALWGGIPTHVTHHHHVSHKTRTFYHCWVEQRLPQWLQIGFPRKLTQPTQFQKNTFTDLFPWPQPWLGIDAIFFSSYENTVWIGHYEYHWWSNWYRPWNWFYELKVNKRHNINHKPFKITIIIIIYWYIIKSFDTIIKFSLI